jgi:hypothetical protein
MRNLLKFGKPNSKLKKLQIKRGVKLITFTLPSGHTCPGAKDCLAKADKTTGKIKDGKQTEFRCFMASLEAVFPSLRKSVWHNLTLIKNALKNGVEACADLICESLPKKFDIVRVHVGGDYFSRNYFLSWCEVAKRNPEKLFYSYTKSLKIISGIDKPKNLVLTASRGGKFDDMIKNLSLKEAKVVFSKEEAQLQNLEIDTDDEHAAYGEKDFALLIHGVQPKGSEAAAALNALKV